MVKDWFAFVLIRKGSKSEITERRVGTIFDLISLVAGVPGLLTLIMTNLVGNF